MKNENKLADFINKYAYKIHVQNWKEGDAMYIFTRGFHISLAVDEGLGVIDISHNNIDYKYIPNVTHFAFTTYEKMKQLIENHFDIWLPFLKFENNLISSNVNITELKACIDDVNNQKRTSTPTMLFTGPDGIPFGI